jgi:two-component system sensor histidine kinase AlgZ
MTRLSPPARQTWAVGGVVFGLSALILFWEDRGAGLPWTGWRLAADLLPPLAYALGFLWLAPAPWRWRQHRNDHRAFAQRVLLAIGVCGAWIMGLVWVDAWLRARAGWIINLPYVMVDQLGSYGLGMVALGAVIAARQRAVREREEVREEAVIAQTRLLQGQLHPHVLFNALNGLLELIHTDPLRAERGVRNLSDLLRRTLRASEQVSFTLGEERALIEDYLALESLRLGPRLGVEWEWEPRLQNHKVPPLLLQPLVENAIKHGISPAAAGGMLRIQTELSGNQIALRVLNSGMPYNPQEGAGLGLKNLALRLSLAFGAYATLRVEAQAPWTVAMILIPFHG